MFKKESLLALDSMLQDDAVACRNMQYFNKDPKVGQPTPTHHDGYCFRWHINRL
jgi:hypothetical protein